MPNAGGLRRGLSHKDGIEVWDAMLPALFIVPLAMFLALTSVLWAADHARAPVPAFCAPAPGDADARVAGYNAGGYAYSTKCFRSLAAPLYVPLGILLPIAMAMSD